MRPLALFQEVVQSAAVHAPTHSHALVFLWALAALAAVQAAVIVVLLARGGWAAIATAPTTNLRIVVSIALASLTVVGVGVVGFATGIWPPEGILNSILLFFGLMMGLDVAQFTAKRFTMDKEQPPPANQDASGGDAVGSAATRGAPPAGSAAGSQTPATGKVDPNQPGGMYYVPFSPTAIVQGDVSHRDHDAGIDPAP